MACTVLRVQIRRITTVTGRILRKRRLFPIQIPVYAHILAGRLPAAFAEYARPNHGTGLKNQFHTPVRVGLIEDRHVRRSQTGVQADETTVVTIAHAGGTAAAFAIMVGTPSCAVPIKILQGELLPAAGTYLVSPAGTGIGKALSRRLPFPGLMVRYICFHFLTVFVFFDFHPVYYFNGEHVPGESFSYPVHVAKPNARRSVRYVPTSASQPRNVRFATSSERYWNRISFPRLFIRKTVFLIPVFETSFQRDFAKIVLITYTIQRFHQINLSTGIKNKINVNEFLEHIKQ